MDWAMILSLGTLLWLCLTKSKKMKAYLFVVFLMLLAYMAIFIKV